MVSNVALRSKRTNTEISSLFDAIRRSFSDIMHSKAWLENFEQPIIIPLSEGSSREIES